MINFNNKMQSNEPAIPFLLRNTKNVTKRNNVRKKLDSSIRSIYDIIKRKSFQSQQKTINLQIPKLDNQLIKQYIMQVYNDYSIPDPLEGMSSKNSPRSSLIETNKKAVELKENFISQMMKSIDTNPSPYVRYQYEDTEHGEIPQVFRYCFICEEPILQANINYHERQKCPNFSTIYQMNLSQIKNKLIEKIKTLTSKIDKNIEDVDHRSIFQGKMNQIAQKTKNYLDIASRVNNEFFDKNSLKTTFTNCLNAFNNEYFQMYENINKLQWFVMMYWNLTKKYSLSNSECTEFLLNSDKYL